MRSRDVQRGILSAAALAGGLMALPAAATAAQVQVVIEQVTYLGGDEGETTPDLELYATIAGIKTGIENSGSAPGTVVKPALWFTSVQVPDNQREIEIALWDKDIVLDDQYDINPGNDRGVKLRVRVSGSKDCRVKPVSPPGPEKKCDTATLTFKGTPGGGPEAGAAEIRLKISREK